MNIWSYLTLEECCYTCINNKNAYKPNTQCDCIINKNQKAQDIYCGKYDLKDEEE